MLQSTNFPFKYFPYAKLWKANEYLSDALSKKIVRAGVFTCESIQTNILNSLTHSPALLMHFFAVCRLRLTIIFSGFSLFQSSSISCESNWLTKRRNNWINCGLHLKKWKLLKRQIIEVILHSRFSDGFYHVHLAQNCKCKPDCRAWPAS